MKKLLILFMAIISLVTSCKKELNEEPFNRISDVDAFSSADRIDKSAVGMYNALQNTNYFGGRILIYADIRGIDASPATFFGNMALFNLLQANDGTTGFAWQGAYRTIYEANLFLKNFAPKMALVSTAKADQYTGEAKFIRSLCYFYLVNMWAQPYSFTADASHLGVPLVLEAAEDPFDVSNNLPRATVKQVYDAMEADLLEAEIKLPATYSDAYTRVSKATRGAARALLMRLYLYKKDYTKAASYANTIITSTSPVYALNSSPITAFRTYTTAESIFSVAHDGGDNPNTNNSIGQHYGATRRADIPISTDFVALYEAGDTRKRATGTDSLIQLTSGAYWTRKYNAGTTDWIPVFRLSEALLTRAEALANLAPGVTADPAAITLLNQVRVRSSASVVAPATKADLLAAIYLERRLELAFEGQGSLDYLRTGREIPAHSIVAAQPFGSNYTILPIPKYDLDKNPNLKPNPGY
jgi:starch-binding outer membrane protein, SusD/RagB family